MTVADRIRCPKKPDCLKVVGHGGPCINQVVTSHRRGDGESEGFIHGESTNPWAASSPDCPAGHHARRVYRWSYEPDDPFPWICVDCRRRFKPVGQ